MTITTPAAVPVFPLSMFGPVHLGIDENGEQVHVNLGERNMLLGGEPGGGKSNALNLIVAHGALVLRLQARPDRRQAGRARPLAALRRHVHRPVHRPTPSPARKWLQQLMNDRYDKLLAAGLRKITPETGEPVYLVVIDEYAYFSATVGDQASSKPSSPRSPATWSPGAGPPGSSSSWPPSGPPTRSSTRPCATCSATGGPSAAPPTHPV